MPDKSSTVPPPRIQQIQRIQHPESSGTGSSQAANSGRIENTAPWGDRAASSSQSVGIDPNTGYSVLLNRGLLISNPTMGRIRMDKICDKATKPMVIALSKYLDYTVPNTKNMFRKDHLRNLIEHWNDRNKKTLIEFRQLIITCMENSEVKEFGEIIELISTSDF